MKGYNGSILRVDLTRGQISVERPSEDYYRWYLGGRGFIIHTVLTEVPERIDPLGPENKLVFALGPVTGHPLVGSGRNSVGSKSPLSGGFGESEAGGFWGTELKRSGYDAIVVEGVSPKPVYLWIADGEAEIRDAENLWGLEVADTEIAIRGQLGRKKARIAAIGPAGEKLVRYASIANDISHVAGRSGMGAVMGSKRLKAIAVRGAKAPEVADRDGIVRLTRWMARNFKQKAAVCGYGTGSSMKDYEETGNLPVRNFAGGRFPGVDKITPQFMFEKNYVIKMDNCFGCPIRCKRVAKIHTPWEVNSVYGGPEYETLAALGSNCGIDNLEALIKANEICNRYGMDTISTGVCVSFAMECFEKGILTAADTDGLALTFGNAEAMLEMVERIALRKGLGNLLGEGVKRASEEIGQGSSQFAMHVKGEEVPMHEPRLKQAMALHYSIHFSGAEHCTGVHDNLVAKNLAGWESIDVAESLPTSELSPRKARMLYHVGLWRQMGNYLGVCLFVPWSGKQLRDAMEFITGWPMSYWRLMKSVERGITLARIFNLREGFSEKDDGLPKRFASSPSEGPLKGVFVDPDKLEEAKRVYYQMLGWTESGVPTSARLVELGIEWAGRYLEEAK